MPASVALVVAALAAVAAVAAVVRMRAYKQLAEQADHRAHALDERLGMISRLHEAGRAVNSALELDPVLGTILRGAVDMLTAETGSVMLCEDGHLVGVAAVGNDNAIGVRIRVGEGIAGAVAESREALLINGHVTSRAFPGLRPRSQHVDSAISVPMIERGELFGVLNVGASATHVFGEADLEAAQAFAEHAAAAIAKARLYENSRRQAAELAHIASHDALTGLPNRSMLRDELSRTGRGVEAAGGALLFVDLDGFKAVNDVLGHAGGDMLLESVARRLATSVSATDTAARVGGDEFAVFVTGATSLRPAVAVAERLIERLAEPFTVFDQSVTVSASIGIALLGVHGDTFEELLRAADRSLYDAKRAGKNRWHACPIPGEFSGQRPAADQPTRPTLAEPTGGALCPART